MTKNGTRNLKVYWNSKKHLPNVKVLTNNKRNGENVRKTKKRVLNYHMAINVGQFLHKLRGDLRQQNNFFYKKGEYKNVN